MLFNYHWQKWRTQSQDLIISWCEERNDDKIILIRIGKFWRSKLSISINEKNTYISYRNTDRHYRGSSHIYNCLRCIIDISSNTLTSSVLVVRKEERLNRMWDNTSDFVHGGSSTKEVNKIWHEDENKRYHQYRKQNFWCTTSSEKKTETVLRRNILSIKTISRLGRWQIEIFSDVIESWSKYSV